MKYKVFQSTVHIYTAHSHKDLALFLFELSSEFGNLDGISVQIQGEGE